MTDSDDAFIAWRDIRQKQWIAARKTQYFQGGTVDDELAERLATEDWENGPGSRGQRPPRNDVVLEGGPEDGTELHGLGALIIENVDPPYICFSIEGRYEHYVRIQGENRFMYAGACHILAVGGGHPDCGHDHTSDW